MNAMERLVSRANFSGKVEPGRRYVLVDDVTTVGSTLADLASYIQENGGEVIGSVLLANATRSGNMFANAKTLKRLEVQYGNEIRELFKIEPNALTQEEAQYLIGFRNADELRGSAIKAQGSRLARIHARKISKGQSSVDQQRLRDIWQSMTLEQKRPYHEQWAQSFELYAMEGVSPTEEMQPVFERFKQWMLETYKSLKEFLKNNPLAGRLNNEVREVFDRLLASDADIAATAAARGNLKQSGNKASDGARQEAAHRALDYVASSVGGTMDYDQPNPYANGNNIGYGGRLVLGDATVQIRLRVDGDKLYLGNIATKNKDDLSKQLRGSGRGTEVVNAIRGYVDKHGMEMYVVDATRSGKKFWDKLPWLKEEKVTLDFDGEPYTPQISYRYVRPEEQTGATNDSLNQSNKQTTKATGTTPPSTATPAPTPAKPFNPNEDIPETRFRKAQRLSQDAFNRFTVIKEWLKKKGVTLSEKADVFQAEERYHSLVANQLEDFREHRRNPLIEKISKAGFTLDDVADFLEAQHAEEANRAIQDVRGDPTATAYGITRV